jgi:hypothetical protein
MSIFSSVTMSESGVVPYKASTRKYVRGFA